MGTTASPWQSDFRSGGIASTEGSVLLCTTHGQHALNVPCLALEVLQDSMTILL